MKILKKIAAAVSSAMLVAALCTSVSAEEVVGFDYAPAGGNFVYYDFTADDGAKGTLTFTKDEDGNLLFSSYKIDIPVPESPEDVHQNFFNDSDFEDYLNDFAEKNGKTPYPPYYTGISANFEVKFDPPLSSGMVSISGSKYYIVDFETMTVSYAGVDCLYEEINSDEDVEEDTAAVYLECTAEDGSKFGLVFDPMENGGLAYACCETEVISDVDYSYSTDENSRVIISSIAVGEVDTGYTLYSDHDMIPLAANEVLVSSNIEQYVEDESGRLAAVLYIKKFFVITVDGMNSTVRYAGCSYSAVNMYSDFEPSSDSNWSDGETTSPNTGNGGRYLNIMLASAGLAILAKLAKNKKD